MITVKRETQAKADKVGESRTKNARQEWDRIRKGTAEINLTPPTACDPKRTEKEINTMSKNEIISKIEAIRDLEELIAEASAEAETLRDAIKQQMLAADTEELTAGQYIVRWTSVLSNRFDSTAFKKSHADLYKAFTKQTASRRFSISA